MARHILPSQYAFTAALSHQQIERFCSTTSPHAVTTRALIASLSLSGDQLMAAWTDAPEAFMELFENAPATIERTKALVELLETAHARLMLTGDVAFNGVDEEKG